VEAVTFHFKSIDSLLVHDTPFVYPLFDSDYTDYVISELRQKIFVNAPETGIKLKFVSLSDDDASRGREFIEHFRMFVSHKMVLNRNQNAEIRKMVRSNSIVSFIR
jgi:hypothetical protein